ncbi:MAG: S41 family peptidase [Bacteroidales bacterium]|jgi:carboxyl-terminal processing protease|nr:S41 family peptidase [Bacteroidales bacterium]
MSSNKWKSLIPLLAAVMVVIGIVIGRLTASFSNISSFDTLNGESTSSKITSLLQLIDRYYVEDVNNDSITEDAINMILADLDPHSAYIPAKDLKSVNEDLDGSFSGIGVQFNIQSDTVMVVSVIHGGPSEKVGLLPGDRIVKVNDSAFVGKSINEDKVVHTLKGPKGTKVKVGIKRASSAKILDYTIVRDDVPLKSVEATYMIAPGIGYIKIGSFGAKTYNEFITAIAKIKKQNAKKVIIDLRGNPGGYLNAACSMINEFLSKGDLIVYTEGKNYPREEEYADGNGSCQDMGVAVLIDEWSASASEIFAGAIQDNDRGIIIGRRSFGKGLVQQQYPFSDSSAVRLTIARYYTPSGRCIQKPYKKGDIYEYETEILQRFAHGEFNSRDSIKHDEKNKFKTKKGRTVYGGGGITADIFVPRDTTGYTPYYNKVANAGLMYTYAFQYVDKHRNELKKFKDTNSLLNHLRRQSLLKDFTKFAETKGVKLDIPQIVKSEKLIEESIYAYIARNIDNTDVMFYQIINQDDKCVTSAVNYLKKQK